MKTSITEFRDMVAAAVRHTLAEAKRKPKEIAPRSEESIQAQRDAQLRGLPGYEHGEVLDLSKPLGKRNRAKKQGAANIGNWTSESARHGTVVDVLESNGIQGSDAAAIAEEIVLRLETLESDPKVEAVRRLVRMIVREEIRVRR